MTNSIGRGRNDETSSWIFRNKANICAGLCAVSVVLGITGVTGWFKGAEGFFILIVICIAMFLGVIVFFTRRKNVALDGPRYLSEEVTNSILGIVVDPDGKVPICVHSAATHAAGIAVATLAARTMLGNICFLRDQFNACSGEAMVEDDFTRDKLEEHINILLGLNSDMACLTDDRSSSPGEGKNLSNMVFRKLPAGYKIIYEDFIEVQRILERQIIRDMKHLFKDKCESAKANCEEEVKAILTEKSTELRGLCGRLETIKGDISSIVEAIIEDWDRDIKQLWENELCVPSSRKL